MGRQALQPRLRALLVVAEVIVTVNLAREEKNRMLRRTAVADQAQAQATITTSPTHLGVFLCQLLQAPRHFELVAFCDGACLGSDKQSSKEKKEGESMATAGLCPVCPTATRTSAARTAILMLRLPLCSFSLASTASMAWLTFSTP